MCTTTERNFSSPAIVDFSCRAFFSFPPSRSLLPHPYTVCCCSETLVFHFCMIPGAICLCLASRPGTCCNPVLGLRRHQSRLCSVSTVYSVGMFVCTVRIPLSPEIHTVVLSVRSTSECCCREAASTCAEDHRGVREMVRDKPVLRGSSANIGQPRSPSVRRQMSANLIPPRWTFCWGSTLAPDLGP